MGEVQWDPKRPRWQQIADVIRQRIQNGTYPPDTLISESRIQSEWGVAKMTARKVVAALRAEGLLVTTPGMGSFVTGDE
ncbi:GntR family transcriptional regulator [Streptomyces sp. KMM 9044]|uniref:GntR family transcriptional regulator n=1 Tax=Streptomyces sp. KMM 9044 TaxID=2744474 RepID=UPI0021515738|nr:GntR family transcriptional regulator [Streptomyces sp. KMM 9044]WAX79960.1 GntR family transcriptional regulator [Streptomyces sp. KMM 9044]